MTHRNRECRSLQRRTKISQRAGRTQAVDFFNVLTSPGLLEATEAHLPAHRERLYSPTVTLSMFMKQVLNEDGSCQQAVNAWAAQRASEGLSPKSIRTGGYCKARQRLPVQMVQALTREVGNRLSEQVCAPWRWHGRVVKLVDGSTISMPDTTANQACFPQPSLQAAGVGFPMARIIGVICLSSGAVLDASMGAFEGKGSGELALFRCLLAAFSRDDVMLADALYCNYFLIATLQAAGVDALFEQHGARITDFRRGQPLAARDHRVCWSKPKNRPHWLTWEQYAAFPEQITVREVKVNGQILVTTMLDHHQVPKSELAALYAQRWNVELDLRNIKATLGLAVLSCHSPQMNEKEFWVHLLAYNLIRLLMAQAALHSGVHPRQISFKHTVQIWMQWSLRGLPRRSAQHDTLLFRLIAQVQVGRRPGRIEPRVRKRRPKPYHWLQVPRDQARQHIRTQGHP